MSFNKFFGVNASQDVSEIRINKADLLTTGFSPLAVNSGESIVYALVLLWLKQYEGVILTPLGPLLAPNGYPVAYQNGKQIDNLHIARWNTQSLETRKRQLIIFRFNVDESLAESTLNPNHL